jgi:hypothetical protein
MTRIFAFLAAILLATSAGAASTTSMNLDIIVTHAGSPVQTLIPVIQPAGTVFQFLAGTGSANRSLGILIGAGIFQPTPAFAGTYSIGGPDAGKFTINSATGAVSVGGSDVAAGNYALVITVSQPSVTGSPVSTPISLQGVDVADTSTLFLAVDNYYPAPGSTIHVTVRNTPNTSGTDYVEIAPTYPRAYSGGDSAPYLQYIGSAGTHNAIISIPAPNPPSDNYQFLHVFLTPNNGAESQAIANTSTILVTPSQPYVEPSATNTLAPPFTPTQTLTVCPSGCMYTEMSLALIGLSNSNLSNTADNVLITMQAGAYEDCQQFGNVSPFSAPTIDRLWHLPQHLWIKGVGGGFARIEGMYNPTFLCESKGLIVFWGNVNDILYLENLELADWSTAGATGGVYLATGSATMRNLYIHDGENCILSGNNGAFDFVLQNEHLARCGGPSGPQHNAYFGDGANTVTMSHSLSEQTTFGHEFKSRAFTTTVTCNQLRGSQDTFFVDSEEVDCPEGRICNISNNTIVKGAGSPQQNQIGWMMDFESGAQPGHTWSLNLSNNIIIYDATDFHWGVYIGPSRPSPGPSQMTSPPDTWTNNIFVGGPPPAAPMTPYYSFSIDGGLGYPDTSQVTEVGDAYYATRAAAGITQTYPPPPGCAGTIGNLAIP